ncbi:MAG: winged helix-turn-helix domain-containing protein [archaeon]|nr:winged helix-turn-helix domain-containing protein [archaeon]
MKVEKMFGMSAGKVWKALNKDGGKSVALLSKETKLKANEVYAALGWLGREGKIGACKKKAGIVYSLC